MGSAIAYVTALHGFEVVVRTRRGQDGMNLLYEIVEKAKQKKFLTSKNADKLLSNLTWTTSMKEAVGEADLVIEAVEEDLEAKKHVFRQADAFCQRHTILSSNTSSLSILKLAEATRRPKRVIGTHFFNPVMAMRLVELASTPFTSKETLRVVISFLEKLDKTPVIVKDSPGFVVNRILLPMINEAAFLFMEGIATPSEIDLAMKLGANHPIGPLALADLIGIDTCKKILDEFYHNFKDPKYEPCPLLTEMVSKGYLGRKSGKGFYNY
jgi:3-hydroxybutyryl-CoA dehydrogenase